MNINYMKILLATLLAGGVLQGYGQTQDSVSKNVITADSLASGNYKDILTSFYQLAVKDLTGPDKQLNFNSNPFAIMLKNNPKLSIDTSYYKYRHLRDLNFGVGVKLDSSYHFNGFSLAVKYALINKRDYTVSRAFIEDVCNSNNEYNLLNDAMDSSLARIADINLKSATTFKMDSLFEGTLTFDMLGDALRKAIVDTARARHLVHFLKLIDQDPKVNLQTDMQRSFDSVKNSFQNKHLLTISTGDTTYSDGFSFKNAEFTLESVRGFLDPNKAANLEWDARASYSFGNDTLQAKRNLRRQFIIIEPGLNLVIKNRESQKSFFEFKISGSYTHIYNGWYTGESKDQLLFSGTIRLRVFNEIWIPLQFKYDPKSGNVFGFLNVTTNFTGLGNLLGGKKAGK